MASLKSGGACWLGKTLDPLRGRSESGKGWCWISLLHTWTEVPVSIGDFPLV